MRVYVQRTAAYIDAFDVWFVEDNIVSHPGRRQVAHFVAQDDGPARLAWAEHDPDVETQPTMRLSGYEAQMLRDGFTEYGPTTSDGLTLAADAIKVRDRLLTLVENLTTDPEVKR